MTTTKAKLANGRPPRHPGRIRCLLWLYRSGNIVQAAANPIRSSTPKVKLAQCHGGRPEQGLKFYTEVWVLLRKAMFPTGEPGGARWLTVVSPEEPDGTELLLEPMGFPPAKTYQKALFEAGIPLTAFAAGDLQNKTLEKPGVKFSTEPTAVGPTTAAVFEDTCATASKSFKRLLSATPSQHPR
jgi:hypothetical protein